MLKMFLCLVLAAAGSVVGLHFSQRLVRRRETLSNIFEMLHKAKVRISYDSGDLFEIFENNFSGFNFSRDHPFGSQWLSFSDTFSDSLNKQDIILIRNFTDSLGTTDREGQLKQLDMFLLMIKERINEAESDIQNKSKLYRVLPLSVCLMISILII